MNQSCFAMLETPLRHLVRDYNEHDSEARVVFHEVLANVLFKNIGREPCMRRSLDPSAHIPRR